MRHQVSGRKLNRTKSHRDALLKNMATSLFEHKKIHTTEAKAKELRPFAESLITKAKVALAKEKQNLLPEGHTVDVHSRRVVGRVIRNKGVLQELFDAIAPAVETRNGGYTRIIKTGIRRGDAGRTAIIELVDWSAPQDGTVSIKSKKKKKVTSKKKSTEVKKTSEVKPEIKEVENKTTEVIEKTEEVIAETTPEKVEEVAENIENTEEIVSNEVENVTEEAKADGIEANDNEEQNK